MEATATCLIPHRTDPNGALCRSLIGRIQMVRSGHCRSLIGRIQMVRSGHCRSLVGRIQMVHSGHCRSPIGRIQMVRSGHCRSLVGRIQMVRSEHCRSLVGRIRMVRSGHCRSSVGRIQMVHSGHCRSLIGRIQMVRIAGGKLWSYLSKFLSRSTEGSFDVPLAKSSHSNEDLTNLAPCPRNSVESRASSSGNRLSVRPLHSSLTLSSQDDSSTQDEEGRESPLKWADSASSSEEECTTSYLTLCKEYGQEQVEHETLSDDPSLKLGDGDSTKDLDLMQKTLPDPFNKFGPEINFDEFKVLNEHGDQETGGHSGMSDALTKSRNSPMELFRIDSKESASDLLGTDFVDKGYSLKPESFKTFSPFQDEEADPETQSLDGDKPSLSTHDTMSRGSNDSVPVISFKEAALDDVSSIDEGRPDLLVNLPGAQPVDTEQSSKDVYIESDVMDSKLLETPDVLQIKSSIDKIIEQQDNLHVVEEHSAKLPSQSITLCPVSVANVDLQPTALGDSDILCSLKPFTTPLVTSSSPSISHESSQVDHGQAKRHYDPCDTQQLSNSGLTKELSTDLMQLQIRVEDTDEMCEGRRDLREDSEIHKIFQELDAKLSEASHFFIPESCIRRWSAEIVVALDALHREGIVCRDLNPNNILLNDRGHIQLTYFSRWTEVEDACDSDAVERMYCAPG
ncbi:hypothetical protein GDO78_010144 [Eleutherodactylus coqui]|uniref:Protein kinase domain-containing protein n=1 Tax=Eleutherodactylus coqui TaxID=57060 RepID=A0A8J6FD65_ELECQ|nr:hypothetical protein GDO78_010144 [Eleutherodactylus coqui]